MTTARFPLVPRQRKPAISVASIPLTLEHGSERVAAVASLEPGMASSVLPYSLGLRLGAGWTGHTIPIYVPGRKAAVQVAPLMIRGSIAPFPSVILFFGWAATDKVPVILGQQNFFEQFDICYHKARSQVEISPAIRLVP